jgi:hypothetical protein
MKRWAVAFANFYDNDITIEFVEASTWQEAIKKHPGVGETEFSSETLNEAKTDFFDCDSLIDVKELPT